MNQGSKVLERHAIGQTGGHHRNRKKGFGGDVGGLEGGDFTRDVAHLDPVAQAVGHETDVPVPFLSGDGYGLEPLGNLRIRTKDAHGDSFGVHDATDLPEVWTLLDFTLFKGMTGHASL